MAVDEDERGGKEKMGEHAAQELEEGSFGGNIGSQAVRTMQSRIWAINVQLLKGEQRNGPNRACEALPAG
eukprot:scaffold288044_cov12-Tisochrysis_lutea.AAC.1